MKTENEKAFLGVRIAPVPAVVAAHVPQLANSGGVMVEGVTDNSPASHAGLKKHDILTHFANQAVTSPEDLTAKVQNQKPDDKVSITYLRGGEKIETTVVLSKMPNSESDKTEARRPMPVLVDPGTFWMTPFDDWLATPDGKKQAAEFDRRERERQSNKVAWSKFQSMSVAKSADGTYTVNVEYRDGDDKDLKREFSGTREEIRKEINKDEELPEDTKEHLLRSLDQQTPDMFRFQWPSSFRDMFDRDWDDFRKKMDF